MKAVIFGCGNCGRWAYYKLKNYYEIVAWSDNNRALWKSKKENITIIEPSEIKKLQYEEMTIVFICMESTDAVLQQLRENGIQHIYLWKKGFFFSADGMYPLELPITSPKNTVCINNLENLILNKSDRIKRKDDSRIILFIAGSIEGSIREHRMAMSLRNHGYKAYFAYFNICETDAYLKYAGVYEELFLVVSLDDLLVLINESDIDFVISSSEIEYLTPLISKTNKKIIYHCHDLASDNRQMSPESLALEYISNTAVSGVIYPSKLLGDDAIARFNLKKEKVFIFENFISESFIPPYYKKKLSENDGQIHAVYEGGITDIDENNKRFFEKIWLKIAESGVYIHFYSNYKKEYCEKIEKLHPKIIYEGNLSLKELTVEMTKYDIGLLLFNVNNLTKICIEKGSPNKLYEYINSKIPVAANSSISSYSFIEKEGYGKLLDLDGDIYKQMKEISKIKIDADILRKRELTAESKAKSFVEFLEKI